MFARMRRQKEDCLYNVPTIHTRLSEPTTPVQARCRQAAWICKSEHIDLHLWTPSCFLEKNSTALEIDLFTTGTGLTAFYTQALLYNSPSCNHLSSSFFLAFIVICLDLWLLITQVICSDMTVGCQYRFLNNKWFIVKLLPNLTTSLVYKPESVLCVLWRFC